MAVRAAAAVPLEPGDVPLHGVQTWCGRRVDRAADAGPGRLIAECALCAVCLFRGVSAEPSPGSVYLDQMTQVVQQDCNSELTYG